MKEKFDITGMSCSACSSKIQNKISALEGVRNCEVNLLTNSMKVEFDDEKISINNIADAVLALGYGIEKKDSGKKSVTKSADDEIKAMKKRIIISFAFLLPLMYVAMGHMWGLPLPEIFVGAENAVSYAFLQFLLSIPVLYVNRQFFIKGFSSLFKGAPNMDTLIGVGSASALLYGVFEIFSMSYGIGNGNMDIVEKYHMDLYFETAAMIPSLITFGKYLEARSKGKTSEAINRLMDLSPKKAIILKDDREIEIDAQDIMVGDIVAIKPGMTIPADAKIVFGSTSVDESMLTGESMPVSKEVGDRVTTATVNKSGYIRCEVLKTGEDTAFYEIIRLIEEASSKKAPISKLADKIAGIFVPVVMVIALLTFIIWMLLGDSFADALSFGICVLVISCPCALGLATPVAVMVGTGKGATAGILIKSGEALELAHKIDTVVFDKTGTITEGKPFVSNTFGEDDRLFEIAYALESVSEHPLADAVCEYCEEKAVNKLTPDKFEALLGLGVFGIVENVSCLGGGYRLMKEKGLLDDKQEAEYQKFAEEGKTVIFFAADDKIIGGFAIEDKIKESAKNVVSALEKMGIESVMLTGDNEKAALETAKKAGIKKVIANVLPIDKEKEIIRLKNSGRCVAMVGDGINDSPALVSADVGMAISTGTDVAIESADIVLMNSDLSSVSNAIALSKKVVKNIRENLFWAFFYNTIGIPLAAGVFYKGFGLKLSPMIGALAMSLSSVCVVTNALRLKNIRFKNEEGEIKETKMKKVIIDGMMCMHCVGNVEAALRKNNIEAIVSLENKCALVDSAVDTQRVKKIIEDAGYSVVAIEE